MRLIDADALKSVEKEIVCEKVRTPYGKDRTAILRVFTVDEIRSAPTIDAEPVRHGHWIAYRSGVDSQCSECEWSTDFPIARSYCPNCGARMDEVSE